MVMSGFPPCLMAAWTFAAQEGLAGCASSFNFLLNMNMRSLQLPRPAAVCSFETGMPTAPAVWV